MASFVPLYLIVMAVSLKMFFRGLAVLNRLLEFRMQVPPYMIVVLISTSSAPSSHNLIGNPLGSITFTRGLEGHSALFLESTHAVLCSFILPPFLMSDK